MTNKILSLGFVALASILPTWADTSPNGYEYSVAQDGMYFLLDKQSYILVDADYTENLVIPDQINGMNVVSVARNFDYRTDFETISLGANLSEQVYFRYCTYTTQIDLSRCIKNPTVYIDGCGVSELTIPSGVNYVSAGGCGQLSKVTFTGFSKNSKYNSFDDCPQLSQVTLHPDMPATPVFPGCTALTHIDIPANVLIIPDNVFYGCDNLKDISLAQDSRLCMIGANAFRGTPITGFDCPPSVKVIGSGAFAYTKIPEFKLPPLFCSKINETIDNVLCYGSSGKISSIFEGCENLSMIDYPSVETLLELPPHFYDYGGLGDILKKNDTTVELRVAGAILETLNIPSSVTEVDLSRTSGLKSIVFEDRTKRIYGYLCYIPTLENVSLGAGETDVRFRYSPALTKVDVSEKNKLTKLYEQFTGCSSLESVYFPYVTTLGSGTFEGCTSLRSISLPNLISFDGRSDSSFEGCTSLEEIDFPNVSDVIGQRCFKDCTSLKKVNLPGITEIGYNAFENCTNLSEIDIPSVTKIGESSFSNCTSLTSFDFSGMSEIGMGSFTNTGLTSVEIPLSCKVSSRAFDNCKELRYLSMPLYYFDTRIYDLPKAEKIILTPQSSDATVNIQACGDQSILDITMAGNISKVYLGNMKNLNRLTLLGQVKDSFSFSNASPQEFDVSSLSDYVSSGLSFGDGSMGHTSDHLIDFFITGQQVNDLLIAPGTEIPQFAFCGFNLESVTFQGLKTDEPTIVNYGAFKNCTNLSEVHFQGNVTTIGDQAFMNTGLVSVDMPSTVTSIGTQCFANNEQLRYIAFSPSLTFFPSGAVHTCRKLEHLIIPEGVVNCGYQIIDGSTSDMLQTISLPGTLDFLSSGFRPSFQNLSSDVEFLSWATVGPGGNMDNFAGITVHVPQGFGQTYSSKPLWANANIIEDLLVGQDATVNGTTVTITVPVQNAISDNAIVVKWTVDCYDADAPEGSEPLCSFTFDGSGNRLNVSARSEAGEGEWQQLSIRDLEPNKSYVFDVKGHTSTNDLVYNKKSAATTENVSGTDNVCGETGKYIILRDRTLLVPSVYGDRILRIFSINGEEVFSHMIEEGGAEIPLSLHEGIYVLTCGDTTLKMKL